MRLPVPVQRRGYQLAYALLRVYWFVFRPAGTASSACSRTATECCWCATATGHAAWEIPGGGVRRHEPPLRAARREMLEELGLDVSEWC